MMTDIRQTIQLEEPRGASLACACLFWPAIVAVILIIVVLLPLAAGYARQYAFAQALQFAIVAVAEPASLALGTSWRTRSPGWPPDSGERSRRLGARPTIRLAAFIAVTITWRPPATVNALARDPALVTAEMITLLAAGTGLWLELTNAPHGSGQLPRPARTYRHGSRGHVDELGAAIRERIVRSLACCRRQVPCISRCMLAFKAASDTASSSWGLNMTNSDPACAAGT